MEATLIRLVVLPTIKLGVVTAPPDAGNGATTAPSLMLKVAAGTSVTGGIADKSSVALPLTATTGVAAGNDPAPNTSVPPLTVVALV